MRIAVALALATALLASGPAVAHRLAPSLLEVRERPSGLIEVRWKTPLVQPRGARLEPLLPDHCAVSEEPRASRDETSASFEWSARCGEGGLVGAAFGVSGLDRSGTQALLRVELADGRTVRALLDGGNESFAVPPRQSPWEVAAAHFGLGFEHIFTGLDHLLFVLGLVLLVSGRRALLGTVTAFTLGHSLTLSLAALGRVGFPSRLAELAIAASVLILALELCREPGRASRLARRPWLMAAAFGLLHGLGFAGALVEVGLPAGEIPLSLLSFNLGIEAGQILFVVAVLATGLALGPLVAGAPTWVTRIPAYTMGSLASFWCIERGVELLL